ncbi:hypothetical protein GCM10022381_39320 [Leifsonia kafniensis]|uniref:Uncharacterized protein n=1 Tax=Leifsonia kafniensis TaxID=475957 RepID=A0ABP7L3V1_9MICO
MTVVAMRFCTARVSPGLGMSNRIAPQLRVPRKATSTMLRSGRNPRSWGTMARKSRGSCAFTIVVEEEEEAVE